MIWHAVLGNKINVKSAYSRRRENKVRTSVRETPFPMISD